MALAAAVPGTRVTSAGEIHGILAVIRALVG